jgi:hypothetical protein
MNKMLKLTIKALSEQSEFGNNIVIFPETPNNSRSFHVQSFAVNHTPQGYELIDGQQSILLQDGDCVITPEHQIEISLQENTSQNLLDSRAPSTELTDIWQDASGILNQDFAGADAVVPTSTHVDHFDPLGFLSGQPSRSYSNAPITSAHSDYFLNSPVDASREEAMQYSSLRNHFAPPTHTLAESDSVNHPTHISQAKGYDPLAQSTTEAVTEPMTYHGEAPIDEISTLYEDNQQQMMSYHQSMHDYASAPTHSENYWDESENDWGSKLKTIKQKVIG